MTDAPLFQAAYPFADDVLALPVLDTEKASQWYCHAFGLTEVDRSSDPDTVLLERDGARIGFAVNGGDPEQDGAAILVTDIHRARAELESRDIAVANWRVDQRDGKRYQVFFVVAPDGLCYYFHQLLDTERP